MLRSKRSAPSRGEYPIVKRRRGRVDDDLVMTLIGFDHAHRFGAPFRLDVLSSGSDTSGRKVISETFGHKRENSRRTVRYVW